MSKEAVALLKGAGYIIKQKMGKQKFISVFRSMNSSARIRRKRAKLITKLIGECFADSQITRRLRRHEDLTDLALKVHHILRHPEYSGMTDKDTLRSTIAHLLVDKEHRESVEKVLKENKKRQWPEYHPLCKAKRIKDPQTVINTIFTNLDKAWNCERGRYNRNKAGIKFQKAVRDLLSRDWITNYCLLAGYVPVMKERKLGYVGKTIGESCGCRTLDRFALRKSSLKKIYREANNYRYHTMKRSLKRIEQRSVMKLHNQSSSDKQAMCSKNPRPGIWTRVFKGTSAQIAKIGASASASTVGISTVSSVTELSEKAFAAKDLKEISSPFLTNKDMHDVAIKAFLATPDLPMKLLPARVLTYMELTTVLDHPNIIPFVESFATNSEIFVVMPYAPNRSLHHIINNHGRLMQKTAQVWTFQIAMAIQYLHAAGIIHRNIKCSNILITQNYDAVLSGFGSAKIKWLDLLHLQETESSNFHAGYRPYRAPEVLRRKPYSLPPIDVWSLGVVLFRMLNNCFPYCYHNKELMCKQQYFSKWKKTWRRDSPVSERCLNLLKKMLEPNPPKRIRIDGVVNHSWFEELPIPNAHKRAIRKAAFLFLPREPKPDGKEEFQPVTKQISHKDVGTTLEELHKFLEKMTKPSENREFQPLETLPAYRECYSKYKLRHGALIRKIDDALRKRIPKIKRPPSPLEYEPYISDQEKNEIQEQTEAGIHELKKRPELAGKFLQTQETDNRMKLSLMEIVKNIKVKSEKMKVRGEELAKKFALFIPKREASEPRSILASTKSIRQAPSLAKQIKLGLTSSTGSMVTWPPSKDRIPSLAYKSVQLATSSQPLPKLEFVKATTSSGMDLTIKQDSSEMKIEPEKITKSIPKSEPDEDERFNGFDLKDSEIERIRYVIEGGGGGGEDEEEGEEEEEPDEFQGFV